MKAASPLCLEPRALLWLLEVEEAEGSCPKQLCVQPGSSQACGSPSAALRLIPQPASQPPTQWMSFGVVGVTFCDLGSFVVAKMAG